MAVTSSRPSGRRADDVRALRFRYRLLAFSGNYATGGETVTAASVGLKRILGLLPMGGMIRAADGVTGNPFTFDVSADGRQVVIRLLEDAAGAAGTAIGQEKTNGEAYIAGQQLPVLFVGE